MAIDITNLTLTTVTSVADLMNWSEQFMEPGASGTSRLWAFRGQSREFHTLVPSFQRLFSGNTHAAAELIEKELMNCKRLAQSWLVPIPMKQFRMAMSGLQRHIFIYSSPFLY